MYDVALSVQSCVNAGTQVHVAWVVDGDTAIGNEAVAITPGGGKMGDLLGGAFDHQLREATRGLESTGSLVDLVVGPAESLLTGLDRESTVTVAVVPGSVIPEAVLADLVKRRPVEFDLELDGNQIHCAFNPLPRAVISGSGPIADALVAVFTDAGWATSTARGVEVAGGLMATLAPIDAAVVFGHDVETSSRALQAAIESNAGYIGSVGSHQMQEMRRQWLSYREVEWSERVHGPAGIDINASTPGEIAISIAAEAIAVTKSGQGPES